ncbi:MAG TPA: PhzF family phenazine biosynthesis protein [Janthinobacterium sp.]|nr:PhzF family phenazine biosynthesis protein [Janthinobacterium sp.]
MRAIHKLLCFGTQAGTGNPALVIENDSADPAARQLFAFQQQITCVFIDADADGCLLLDYFYPHMRSPLCLHATLAAAQRLFARPGQAGVPTIAVKTAMHGQTLILLNMADGLFVRLAPQAFAAPPIAAELPAALLNAPGIVLASAPAVASVGSPKLLLEVADCATLRALRPDLDLIAAWSRQHGVSGCYAYCALGQGRYEGRNFNHLEPKMEDSATGVAAGALTLHLQTPLQLFQGAALGHACLIRSRWQEGQVLIGGAVETAAYAA